MSARQDSDDAGHVAVNQGDAGRKAGVEQPDRSAHHPLPSWVSTLTTVGSPIALVTALLLYFGWVRADAQARELGYDVSLLHYSTTDYVLRSVNVLFLPVVALLVASLAVLWLHRRIENWAITNAHGQHRDTILRIGISAWVWMPALLSVGLIPWSSAVWVTMIPFLITVGLMISLYSRSLQARVYGLPAPGRFWLVLITSLLVALLFWDVQRIASAFGTEYAKYIKTKPSQFAEVSLLSEKPLNVERYRVTVTDAGISVSHRYRYAGFWLMNYANSRYFLLTHTGNDETVVVVVPESADIQLAFDASG